MSECNHKFVDSDVCLKCGRSHASLLRSELTAARKLLADVTAQRDQANRTCSDALNRAERAETEAETEAGDLRKRLDELSRLVGAVLTLPNIRDGETASFPDRILNHALYELVSSLLCEQRAHAETRTRESAANEHLRREQTEHAETRDALQRAEERSSLNFREFERVSKELAETRGKLSEKQPLLERASFRDLHVQWKAEQAVLDELANAKIVPACNRGIQCCAKFEEPYEKYVCCKELARREAAK